MSSPDIKSQNYVKMEDCPNANKMSSPDIELQSLTNPDIIVNKNNCSKIRNSIILFTLIFLLSTLTYFNIKSIDDFKDHNVDNISLKEYKINIYIFGTIIPIIFTFSYYYTIKNFHCKNLNEFMKISLLIFLIIGFFVLLLLCIITLSKNNLKIIPHENALYCIMIYVMITIDTFIILPLCILFICSIPYIIYEKITDCITHFNYINERNEINKELKIGAYDPNHCCCCCTYDCCDCVSMDCTKNFFF